MRAKTNTARLDRVQNSGLRTILGAMKSTPTCVMERTARIQPLEDRRQDKPLNQGEKQTRLQNHPLHIKLHALTKNRLKRWSPNHQLKAQQEEHADILQENPELCKKLVYRLMVRQSRPRETEGVESTSRLQEDLLKFHPALCGALCGALSPNYRAESC